MITTLFSKGKLTVAHTSWWC